MSRIILNIGGKLFHTTQSTLEHVPFFDALLSKRWERKDKDVIFIDRDPKGFKHVLGFLRDPQYPFPQEYAYELKFYGIDLVPIDCQTSHTRDIQTMKKLVYIKGVEFYNKIFDRIYDAIYESENGEITMILKTCFEMRRYECDVVDGICTAIGATPITGWSANIKPNPHDNETYRKYRIPISYMILES